MPRIGKSIASVHPPRSGVAACAVWTTLRRTVHDAIFGFPWPSFCSLRSRPCTRIKTCNLPVASRRNRWNQFLNTSFRYSCGRWISSPKYCVRRQICCRTSLHDTRNGLLRPTVSLPSISFHCSHLWHSSSAPLLFDFEKHPAIFLSLQWP